MGPSFKDYYSVLGLPRDASESDIKNSYRKLARMHHPDLFSVGMKRAAEERFKAINEAYEVLRDSKKRGVYDQLYTSWMERTRSPFQDAGLKRRKWDKTRRGRSSSARGEEGKTEAWGGKVGKKQEPVETPPERSFSDFFQSLFNTDEKEDEGGKDREPMPDEPKTGADIESEITLTLEEVVEGTKRRVAAQRESRCLFCQGRGLMGRQTCPRCKGAGMILQDKELAVTIPAGVREGDRIRLAGQGEPGVGGGPTGNRYITVRFEPHAQFHLADDHLVMDLAILPWEAALGAEQKIKTLYGNVILKIPPGTQNGQQFRLLGKGLPIRKGGKQDLYVRVAIQMPSSMTPEEREHYMELARLAKKR